MSRRFARAFTLTCESTLDSGIVDKFRDEKFDVYIVEGMDICGLSAFTFNISIIKCTFSVLAHLIQPKSIIMASTTMIHGEQHEDIGVPQILSFNPSHFFLAKPNISNLIIGPNVASHDIHSLWDRLWNFYAEWLIRELLRPSRVSITDLFIKRFGPTFPSIRVSWSRLFYPDTVINRFRKSYQTLRTHSPTLSHSSILLFRRFRELFM